MLSIIHTHNAHKEERAVMTAGKCWVSNEFYCLKTGCKTFRDADRRVYNEDIKHLFWSLPRENESVSEQTDWPFGHNGNVENVLYSKQAVKKLFTFSNAKVVLATHQ